MPSKLECTAFHEASHAVAFFLLRVPFRYVSIEPDVEHNLLGIVHAPIIKTLQLDEGTISMKARDFVERRVIALLAGFIGEKKFYSRSRAVGAATDHEIVCDFVRYLCQSPKEEQPYIDWLSVRSELLLDQNWNVVDSLATALILDRTISSRRAIRIMKQALE